jgi:hypothetical protein
MATRVFHDDFESYSVGTLPIGQWVQDDYRNMPQVVSSSIDGLQGPHGGSKMLRCNWDGTVLYNVPEAFETAAISTVPYTNEIFYRVWWRPDNDLDRTSPSSTKIIRIFNLTGADNDIFCTIMAADELRNEGLVWGNAYTTEYFATPASSTANWHKVEYYFNQSTGVVRTWIEGVLITDTTKTPTSDPMYPFYIASNWSDAHDATNHVYFDDVEVFSDATSGDACTGSMSDGTIEAGGVDVSAPTSGIGRRINIGVWR